MWVISYNNCEKPFISLSSASIFIAKYFVMRVPTPPSWATAGNINPSLLCGFAELCTVAHEAVLH